MKVQIESLLLALPLGLTCLAGSAAAQSWSNFPDMPVTRLDYSASVGTDASNEKLIFAFGGTVGLSTISQVDAFNRTSGGFWTTVQPMPYPRHGTTAVTAENGSSEERIYVFGGGSGTTGATTTCWAYDPVNDVWDDTIAQMPFPRAFADAALGSDGLIYVFGGRNGNGSVVYDTVLVYDPAADLWLPNAASMPVARRRHAAVAACDGYIYMIGGENGSGVVGDLHVFDPTSGWLTGNPHVGFAAWPPMPTPRTSVGAAVGRNGHIYALGGAFGSPVTLDTHESFDPDTNTWSFGTPMLTSRSGFELVGLGSRVYALGGYRKLFPNTPKLEAWGALGWNFLCDGIVPLHNGNPWGNFPSCDLAFHVTGGLPIVDIAVGAFEDDWYEFTVDDGQRLDVALSFLPSEGDIDLYLYGACGVAPLLSSTGQTGEESIEFSNFSGASMQVKLQVTATSPFGLDVLYDFEAEVTDAPPLGTTYCSPAIPNSSGQPASITASGSDVAADNLFFLSAENLPTNQFGYFLTSETQAFIQNPGGSQGNLCVVGGIGRFTQQIQHSGSTGTFGIQVDLTDIPTTPTSTVMTGESWSWQCWYRDNNPNPTSNFTDAVEVIFQ